MDKPKVKICKCGAGIPPFSNNTMCYSCMNEQPKSDKTKELKQIINKATKTVAKKKTKKSRRGKKKTVK